MLVNHFWLIFTKLIVNATMTVDGRLWIYKLRTSIWLWSWKEVRIDPRVSTGVTEVQVDNRYCSYKIKLLLLQVRKYQCVLTPSNVTFQYWTSAGQCLCWKYLWKKWQKTEHSFQNLLNTPWHLQRLFIGRYACPKNSPADAWRAFPSHQLMSCIKKSVCGEVRARQLIHSSVDFFN